MEKLNNLGLQTVADLAAFDVKEGRDVLTVAGARVIMELQGTSCLSLTLIAPPRKATAVTRTFDGPSRMGRARPGDCRIRHACEREAARASGWSQRRTASRSSATPCAALARSSGRAPATGKARRDAERPIDAKKGPNQLFQTRDPVRSARLMAAMDNINGRFGTGTVRPAVSGIQRRWTATAQYLSHRYTTRLNEILAVRA